MSFLQSSEWTFSNTPQNPQTHNCQPNLRKTSYDCSNLSTRKDSTDSLDLKFKYKTEVCKYWVNGQYCPFEGFCSFAHGFVERRYREDLSSKYKTKLCKNFVNNSFCSYGTRCQFLHPQKLSSEQIDQQRYIRLMNLAEQNLPLFFAFSKRLKVFCEITDQQAMKDLLGQGYIASINENSFSRLILNGKPRFYSI